MNTDKIKGRTPEEIKWALKHCNEPVPTACTGCPYNGTCLEHAPEIDALALIEHLEAERNAALAKVPKWISVKYRLPEKDDNVLISLCGCNVKQAVYRGDGVFEAAYADTYHSTDLGSIVLTHWMPTPKPMEVSE